jgi:hypothetical protein
VNSKLFQLKYHESGKEKTVAPSVGQWNMINKVILFVGELDFLILLFIGNSISFLCWNNAEMYNYGKCKQKICGS